MFNMTKKQGVYTTGLAVLLILFIIGIGINVEGKYNASCQHDKNLEQSIEYSYDDCSTQKSLKNLFKSTTRHTPPWDAEGIEGDFEDGTFHIFGIDYHQEKDGTLVFKVSDYNIAEEHEILHEGMQVEIYEAGRVGESDALIDSFWGTHHDHKREFYKTLEGDLYYEGQEIQLRARFNQYIDTDDDGWHDTEKWGEWYVEETVFVMEQATPDINVDNVSTDSMDLDLKLWYAGEAINDVDIHITADNGHNEVINIHELGSPMHLTTESGNIKLSMTDLDPDTEYTFEFINVTYPNDRVIIVEETVTIPTMKRNPELNEVHAEFNQTNDAMEVTITGAIDEDGAVTNIIVDVALASDPDTTITTINNQLDVENSENIFNTTTIIPINNDEIVYGESYVLSVVLEYDDNYIDGNLTEEVRFDTEIIVPMPTATMQLEDKTSGTLQVLASIDGIHNLENGNLKVEDNEEFETLIPITIPENGQIWSESISIDGLKSNTEYTLSLVDIQTKWTVDNSDETKNIEISDVFTFKTESEDPEINGIKDLQYDDENFMLVTGHEGIIDPNNLVTEIEYELFNVNDHQTALDSCQFDQDNLDEDCEFAITGDTIQYGQSYFATAKLKYSNEHGEQETEVISSASVEIPNPVVVFTNFGTGTDFIQFRVRVQGVHELTELKLEVTPTKGEVFTMELDPSEVVAPESKIVRFDDLESDAGYEVKIIEAKINDVDVVVEGSATYLTMKKEPEITSFDFDYNDESEILSALAHITDFDASLEKIIYEIYDVEDATNHVKMCEVTEPFTQMCEATIADAEIAYGRTYSVRAHVEYDNGEEIVAGEVIESGINQTIAQPTTTYELIDVTDSALTIKIAIEGVDALTEAQLQVVSEDLTEEQTITLDASELTSDNGTEILVDNLSSDTNYDVSIVNAKINDQDITIEEEARFITRAEQPTINGVGLTFDEQTGDLVALHQGISSVDRVTDIDYEFFNVNNPDENWLCSKIVGDINDPCKLSVSENNLQVGETYSVKVRVEYDDNYDNSLGDWTISEDQVILGSNEFTAEFTFQSATTNSLLFNIKLNPSNSSILASGNLIISDSEGIIHTLSIDAQEIVSSTGSDFEIVGLDDNTNYQLSFDDMMDDGGNSIQVLDTITYITRANEPSFDDIVIAFDDVTNTLQVNHSELSNANTVSSIEYEVFTINDSDFNPITCTVENPNLNDTCEIQLSFNSIEVEDQYSVRSRIFYNDNYDDAITDWITTEEIIIPNSEISFILDKVTTTEMTIELVSTGFYNIESATLQITSEEDDYDSTEEISFNRNKSVVETATFEVDDLSPGVTYHYEVLEIREADGDEIPLDKLSSAADFTTRLIMPTLQGINLTFDETTNYLVANHIGIIDNDDSIESIVYEIYDIASLQTVKTCEFDINDIDEPCKVLVDGAMIKGDTTYSARAYVKYDDGYEILSTSLIHSENVYVPIIDNNGSSEDIVVYGLDTDTIQIKNIILSLTLLSMVGIFINKSRK